MQTRFNDIIIIGAGPTGLMLANQLSRFGISYIILDQKSGTTDQSRALVVQARSMEIYEQLGLSDSIIADGQKNDGLDLYKNGRKVTSVTLVNEEEDSSPFPFLMMYEQSKNEELLYKNLLKQHCDVEWNTVITSIEKEDDLYILKAIQNETALTYNCRYLIACDGSKSFVRDYAKVPFTGGTYLNVFYVADTHVDAGFSADKLSLFLSPHSIALLFPMKGENHFRALGILPKAYYNRDDVPFEQILENAKSEINIPVTFYDTTWHSTYKLHHKKVARFNKDNIFFAGDAAHVHSPAGGQGMNTGLQDAYNLGWKLALVQKGIASPALLDTYHEERNPVADNLLKTTDRLFQVMSSDRFWYSIFRLYIVPFMVPLVTRSKAVRKELFRLVSQLKIGYTGSSLSKGKAGKVKAGSRLPYCLLIQENATISIYKLLNKNTDNPFTILSYNLPLPDITTGRNLFNLIPLEVNEHNEKALKRTGLPPSFIMVIRPDNYIAWISSEPNTEDIKTFMRKAYKLDL